MEFSSVQRKLLFDSTAQKDVPPKGRLYAAVNPFNSTIGALDPRRRRKKNETDEKLLVVWLKCPPDLTEGSSDPAEILLKAVFISPHTSLACPLARLPPCFHSYIKAPPVLEIEYSSDSNICMNVCVCVYASVEAAKLRSSEAAMVTRVSHPVRPLFFQLSGQWASVRTFSADPS